MQIVYKDSLKWLKIVLKCNSYNDNKPISGIINTIRSFHHYSYIYTENRYYYAK